MKKYGQLSPERAKVWTEKSPKYQQVRKVHVVYYLCQNRQFEHPHFIEVPLSSPEGLYLRDVIQRLNVLRGKGIAYMYSWSSKRSYKNGFVWHDLCEDDLILPAHGNEYVLKGSELFEESSSDRSKPLGNTKLQNPKQVPEPATCRSQYDSSSSSSMNGKDGKHFQDDDISPTLRQPDSSGTSPEYRVGKTSSWNGSLNLTGCKIYKNDGQADAATQTEENVSRPKTGETCTRGVSTDDGSYDPELNEVGSNQIPRLKYKKEICGGDSISPLPSSSSASSSGGKTETLESLIRADASKINSFRILEEEDVRMPTNGKVKATSVLMQLISCGSLSVKDHSFGIIPTYRPRFSYSKFSSPLYSTSVMFGDLDCFSESSRQTGLRLEDKEYFSGNLIEKKPLKEQGDGVFSLKRSSSFNGDRTSKELVSVEDEGETTPAQPKSIPRSILASLDKQPGRESGRSPLADKPRNSSDGIDISRVLTSGVSDGCSKRFAEPSSSKRTSKRLDSFRREESIVKIEERLASGARVIIQQSQAPGESSSNSD